MVHFFDNDPNSSTQLRLEGLKNRNPVRAKRKQTEAVTGAITQQTRPLDLAQDERAVNLEPAHTLLIPPLTAVCSVLSSAIGYIGT